MKLNEYQRFKDSVDSWMKHFNKELGSAQFSFKLQKEMMEYTEHIHECLQELREEIEEIKADTKLMKIIMLTHLKDFQKMKDKMQGVEHGSGRYKKSKVERVNE